MNVKFVDLNRVLVAQVATLGIDSVCGDYFAEAKRTPNAVLMTASNPSWTFGAGIDAAFEKHFPKEVAAKRKRKEWIERRKNICFCVTVDSNLRATPEIVSKALAFALRKTGPDETLLIHGAGTGIGGLSHDDFLRVLTQQLVAYRVIKDPTAVSLGKRGGLAKNSKLTPEQRKAIGARLAEARKAKRQAKQSNNHKQV